MHQKMRRKAEGKPQSSSEKREFFVREPLVSAKRPLAKISVPKSLEGFAFVVGACLARARIEFESGTQELRNGSEFRTQKGGTLICADKR